MSQHSASSPLSAHCSARAIDVSSAALLASDFFAFLMSALFTNLLLYWFRLDLESKTFGQLWAGTLGETRIAIFSTLVVGALIWFYMAGHYTKRRPFWDEIAQATRVVIILAAIDAILLYLTKLQFSRFWFLGTWGMIIILLPAFRSITKDILIAKERWQRPTIIFGTGCHADQILKALVSEPMMGLTPVAFASFGDPVDTRTRTVDGISLPVLTAQELSQLPLKQARRTSVFVALDDTTTTLSATIVQKLSFSFTDVRLVPPVTTFPLYGARVHHLFRQELFFLTLRNNLGRFAPRVLKRAFDIALASFLLILLMPILFLLYTAVRADGANAFFGHRRIGMHGKPFPCYKFRTMIPNAQQVLQRLLEQDPAARKEWEQTYKLKNDPRITKLGHWLRRTSLDELPQLWNVFCGHMSLVGPRPIVEAELQRYGDDSVYYLETRPGMTGVWQISGRNDTDYAFRVYLDSWYAKNWSLWYDVIILLKTLKVVFARHGAY